MNIVPEPLGADAFAPFGHVIQCGGGEIRSINAGTCERHHALAPIDHADGRKPIMSIFRTQGRSVPLSIGMMERHPLGSQAFVPMNVEADGTGDWLVIVAADRGGRPDVPQAFIARADQGVSYNANIWHHPLVALGSTRSFLVVDADGPEANLEEFVYDVPYEVASTENLR